MAMNIEKIMKQRGTSSSEGKVFERLSSKVTSKKVENDSTYALRISRFLFKTLGIWRWKEAEQSLWRFVLGNISVITCYAGLGMCVIPTGLYIAEIKDPIGKIKLTGPWSFCLMAAMKYIFLRSHRCDIEKCMKHMDLDWSTIESARDRKTMREHARYGHLVTITCAIFAFSGGLFFSILPFVVGKLEANDYNNYNSSSNNIIARQHSLPSNFVFFIATETPVYEIVYVIQLFVSFMMHSIAVTCYSLAVVIVMHVCGQLRIIMENIDKLVNGQDESSTSKNIDGKISDIVRRHVRTLKLISSGERMLREICLVDLGGGTLNLCFLGYFFLLELRSEVTDSIALITYAILFGSFMFNVFSFCYIGELLTGECRKVSETTYMINWYHLPGKKSLALCLIIAMAQKPVNLTAGGAIQFSYVCFTSVVKTSIGYLNMLRAVMD